MELLQQRLHLFAKFVPLLNDLYHLSIRKMCFVECARFWVMSSHCLKRHALSNTIKVYLLTQSRFNHTPESIGSLEWKSVPKFLKIKTKWIFVMYIDMEVKMIKGDQVQNHPLARMEGVLLIENCTSKERGGHFGP